MDPRRRTALSSVGAAAGLIALKLSVGLAARSLGLVSEAVHSGTDLVAALLTFLAVDVAGRPPDREHPYGHGKAEHLSALLEAGILVVASLAIAGRAIWTLVAGVHHVDAAWWALATVGVVIVVDAGRTLASARTARRHGSAAIAANALHFAGDLVGSLAVLAGLLLARAGYPAADPAAAIFVALLVLVAAGRLMATNADILLDRAPPAAEERARGAIAALAPAVQLRRLRLRTAGGRHFADAVIAVAPDAAVGQGHAAASAVEDALDVALPGSDVVVHVEPREDASAAVRERALAAALSVGGVRELHNVRVVRVGPGVEISLHLKLPGELSLEAAHRVASRVEAAIHEAVPEARAVATHLEPLGEPSRGRAAPGTAAEDDLAAARRAALAVTGRAPREARVVETDDGPLAYVTLELDPATTLHQAHEHAREVKRRVRAERPGLADVFVHTEP
jgi:cation diffusion facilitator family transporter